MRPIRAQVHSNHNKSRQQADTLGAALGRYTEKVCEVGMVDLLKTSIKKHLKGVTTYEYVVALTG